MRDEEAWNRKGNELLREGRVSEALRYYVRAIERNPEFHPAWHNLGLLFRRRGELERAEECFAKADRIQTQERRNTA